MFLFESHELVVSSSCSVLVALFPSRTFFLRFSLAGASPTLASVRGKRDVTST